MRIDPIEVFGNALTITPLRVLAVWLAGSIGAFLPILVNLGFDSFSILGWQFAFIPFYLFIVSFSSGLWLFAAVPLLLVLCYKSLKFIVGDNGGSDLMVILTLSYFIGLAAIMPHWIVGAVIGAVIVWFTVWVDRRDLELNPY